jgi:hypothetical protein
MAKSSFTFFSIAAVAAGCSVLIDVDGKQCEADADCVTRGFQGAVCSSNLCIAMAAPDPGGGGQSGAGGAGSGSDDPLVCNIEPSPEATVKFNFAPVFAVPPEVPKPFSIKACLSLDPDCESPVFGPIDVNAGEPQDFIVPKLFNGYFEISNPDTRTGLYFMGRAVAKDTIAWNVTVPNDQTIAALGLAAGEPVDLEKGVMIAVARDCNLLPLEGATFENSEGGLRFYFYQTTPDPKATKTGPQGAVGFANFEVGTTTLTAVAEDGTELTPVLLRLKQGYISFAEVFP